MSLAEATMQSAVIQGVQDLSSPHAGEERAHAPRSVKKLPDQEDGGQEQALSLLPPGAMRELKILRQHWILLVTVVGLLGVVLSYLVYLDFQHEKQRIRVQTGYRMCVEQFAALDVERRDLGVLGINPSHFQHLDGLAEMQAEVASCQMRLEALKGAAPEGGWNAWKMLKFIQKLRDNR